MSLFDNEAEVSLVLQLDDEEKERLLIEALQPDCGPPSEFSVGMLALMSHSLSILKFQSHHHALGTLVVKLLLIPEELTDFPQLPLDRLPSLASHSMGSSCLAGLTFGSLRCWCAMHSSFILNWRQTEFPLELWVLLFCPCGLLIHVLRCLITA